MTLEDFFTLTEMKDGFSSTSRVEELIASLVKQKKCTLSTVADAARQWSAVARILVATEDNDCLVRFIELDGLLFLNQWLQDAVVHEPKVSDDAVQELICLVLRALQKLPVDMERLSGSGVSKSVKEVLNIENNGCHEMAKELLAQWKPPNSENMVSGFCEIGADTSLGAEGRSSTLPIDVSLSKLSPEGVLEHAHENTPNSNTENCPDTKINATKDTGIPKFMSQLEHISISGAASVACKVSSPISDISNSYLPAVAEHSSKSGGGDSPSNFLDANISSMDNANDSVEGKTCPEASKEVDVVMNNEVRSCKSNADSPASPLPAEECKPSDLVMDGSDTEAMIKPSLNVSGITASNLKYMENTESESNKEEKPLNECSHQMISGSDNRDESSNETSSDDSSNEVAGLSYMLNWKGEDSRESSHSSKQANSSETDTRSEIRFDFGDDALEFAVRVAIEAQHEVADREQCSSSSKSSEPEVKCNDIKAGKSLSGEVSSPAKNTAEKVDNMENACVLEPTKESPPSSLIGQEPAKSTHGNKCIFDLNEAVCNEDAGILGISCFGNPNNQSTPTNLSTPIPVFARSKGPPVLPGASIQFEGELGWKGTAATSAFRPASSRRTPDSVSLSKERTFLGIDLNLIEGEDETKTSSILDLGSSVLLSGDSSVQFSSVRGEKLKLDLNQLGEEDSLPSASSSHRVSLPSGMRNFDLNDDLSAPDALPLALNRSADDSNYHKRVKSDDSPVTFMGSSFLVDQRELNSLIHPGLAQGPSVAASTPPRVPGGLPHLGFPSYGYSGPPVLPNQFLPSVYGHASVPYVVDSKGAIVVPQLFGGSMEFSGPFTSAPPFSVNLPTSRLGLVSDGTTRPSLNLSSEFLPPDGGNRELGGFRQVHVPGGHSLLPQEQIRASSPPTFSSGLPLKRKEPDPGWDCSGFGYRKVTPWH